MRLPKKIHRTIQIVALLTYIPFLFAEETNAEEGMRTPTIASITITGNDMVPEEALLNHIPFKVHDRFRVHETRKLLHNLFYALKKRFKSIEIWGEYPTASTIDLHINIKEKTPVKKIVFKGNKKIKESDLKKKVSLSDVVALVEEELSIFEDKIKKLYKEKNYHNTEIQSSLTIDDKDNKGIVTFTIKEGPKSMVKRVHFAGNNNISDKELRGIIFTREEWPFSFLNNAGSFHPEALESDKHIIEQHYQCNGYMTAKVTNAIIDMNEETKQIEVTFEIEEGDLFTVNEVVASGKDILKDDYLSSRLPVQQGDLYSREKVVDSIKALEVLWGEMGYIYAHVTPSIQPNEEEKTVAIKFSTDLGKKIYLNKINIVGNKKTHDKVIRRKLLLSEGQLLTTRLLDISKDNVEGLGFFEQRDGVTWRKIRLDDEHADLELLLKEIKTGKAHFKVGYGGNPSKVSATTGLSVGVEVADRNLFGSGIQFMLNGSWAKEEQSIIFNVMDPWLFDLPIMGACDIYHRRPSYDEFRNTRAVNEKLTGGSGTLGFLSSRLWNSQVLFKMGLDSVKYEQKPIASVYKADNTVEANKEYQTVLDQLFESSKFLWLDIILSMDRVNHPMHPSRGYKWLATSHIGLPTFSSNTGFYKLDLDAAWYTPLIGERDLVLKLHGYLGFLHKFSSRTVPYRELFHIGGPTSIRGFLFGQAGPQFLGDSIGGTKAFYVNAELTFPITPNFNMKGVVFYDGGSGWDTPYKEDISDKYLLHNSFKFRHAVGVGLRILNPVPIKIDWGFKLDHNKKLSESTSEIHFSMSYDF